MGERLLEPLESWEELGMTDATGGIPLIDLQRWRQGSSEERHRLAVEVDLALGKSAFFVIVNHGIPAGERDQVRAAARRFFSLPDSIKARYATAVGGRGWIPPGREANAYYGVTPDAALADLKESYTIGRDYRTGSADTDEMWFAPNVWPEEVPELEGLCTAFAGASRKVLS